jgi:hypothetical protein
MSPILLRIRPSHIFLIVVALAVAPVVASPIAVSTVTPAALQTLLPAADGWTKVADAARQVAVSPGCDYSMAFASYTRGAMRAKLTIADTGGAAECLGLLVPMIAALPEGHAETVAPSVTVARTRHEHGTAAERWDGAGRAGDLEILVGGRFVLTLEGRGLESLDDLRPMLKAVDLKKLAEMK